MQTTYESDVVLVELMVLTCNKHSLSWSSSCDDLASTGSKESHVKVERHRQNKNTWLNLHIGRARIWGKRLLKSFRFLKLRCDCGDMAPWVDATWEWMIDKIIIMNAGTRTSDVEAGVCQQKEMKRCSWASLTRVRRFGGHSIAPNEKSRKRQSSYRLGYVKLG